MVFEKCEHCGMLLTSNTEYHPYAACIMYWQTRQSEKVISMLGIIIAYGMQAQEQGVSLSEAMQDISAVTAAGVEE